MVPDPSTTRIVHDAMIAEELARHAPGNGQAGGGATPRAQRPAGARQAIARSLVRLADRIMPAPALEPERAA